ncbi:hypothetical protein JCM3775_006512 [Rhodotorula graminis]|uniref:Uncharacterized protein n=1 Tax=Rhodotorula graminis (strain WP1) TaxID=578459 RepID=A0A0P9F1D1_RHOGW|nr:uncharacterized protein RHOBADRAFT_55145 [Rhodotorula graminis WP1]KPV73395.1 hypothetical protein RHOBADRAFT_55145 [Rhodotorula graminis WP1]
MLALPVSPLLAGSTSTSTRRPWQRFTKDDRGLVAAVVAVVLLIFIASASRHPAVATVATAATASLGRLPDSLKAALQQHGQRPVVWASTQHGLVQKFFDAPFDEHRATFIHAVVRSENDTYRREDAEWDRYVSVPVHVEKLPWYNPAHQIKSTPTDFVSHIECSHAFLGKVYDTRAFESHVGWVSFVGCPLPRELDAVLDANPRKLLETTIKWVYKEDKGSFSKTLTLKAHHPEAESEFGICLSPIWGHLDARATLEWRENMRLLGVKTVHWHARAAVVGDWVERYNYVTGSSDTFMYAPPMSLETYGHRNNMADNGLYGDQIVYYISCKFRSHQKNPTRWLAHLDRDEDFMPKVFPSAALAAADSLAQLSSTLPEHFASLPDDLGTACYGKSYHAGLVDVSSHVSPKVAHTQPLELAYYDQVSEPSPSVKCMHRINAYEVASVHYGERWFPGFRSERFENGTEWMSDAVPFRFLHQLPRNGRLTLPDNYTAPYVRDDLEAYLALLWETREETWDKLEWVCDQIPCRFEADEA